MNREENPQNNSRLESAKMHFDEWRRARLKRRPIPDDLWAEALELVGEYTPNAVVQALRLNAGELKKRLARRSNDKPVASAIEPAKFVELDLSISPPGAPAEIGEYTLELEGASGSKLRLRAVGRLDVARLVQAFWERSE